MGKLEDFPLTLFDIGVLSADIADNKALSSCGKLRVIDRDRIEQRNLFLDSALDIPIDGRVKQLTTANVRQL